VRKIHVPRTASSIPVRAGGTNPQKQRVFGDASAESRLVRLETGTYRIGASETRSALRQLADGRAAVVDTVDAQPKMTLDGAVAVEICRGLHAAAVGSLEHPLILKVLGTAHREATAAQGRVARPFARCALILLARHVRERRGYRGRCSGQPPVRVGALDHGIGKHRQRLYGFVSLRL